jgi:imidazolonepropionase
LKLEKSPSQIRNPKSQIGLGALNIIHAAQLVTLRGPARARRGSELSDLGIIRDGAVTIRNGIIEWVGPTDELPDKRAPEFDASGKVVLPGFVDSHTHAVFTRTRTDEFEWRIEGTPYMEILARGGGILSSVKATRETPTLHVQLAPRFFEHGTTTIEAKSGYGLNLETEIRMLEAMRAEQTLEVVPTYLGAHALPLEFVQYRSGFIDKVIDDLDTIAERKLAEFCDVFVEPGVFTTDEARRIFSKARSLGLHIKIHADEFQSSGGAALAVEVGATSADHLGAITDADIERIAESNVVATLLPATLFMMGEQRYAPARKLIGSGASVALATDFNPGTSPTLNMQFVLSLACTQMKMTPAEAITASTINAACAVRREHRIGSIEQGKQADLGVYELPDYREIPYFAAVNFCVATFKRGDLAWRKDSH